MKRSLAISCVAALVATQAFSFTWKAKSIAEEKSALIARLERSDVACPGLQSPQDFAARLAGDSGTISWMQAAIDYGSALLKVTEGRDATDPVRRLGLEVIDYPLHVDNYGGKLADDERNAFNEAVLGYARTTRDRVVKEVRAARVPDGQLWIWRIYNMAFILKGPQHTVAIDLTSRPVLPRAPQVWAAEDWKAVAEIVDLAVVTHPHGDHTSEPFLREMMRLGKPLVLPGDVSTYVIREGRPVAIPYTTGPSCVKLVEDHKDPVDVAGVGFRNFRGFQDSVPCNVYLMDIDGVRVVDNGDNYDRGKEKMLEQAPPADVVIASTWNQVHHVLTCVQAAPGFSPEQAVFVPAHENELGHSVAHRESYLEMYTMPERLGKPAFPLTRTFPLGWGECLKYVRGK